MRKALVSLLPTGLLAGLLVSLTGVLAFSAQVPRKAPEFVIQSPEGKQQLLSSYRGKTVVLSLMFTTCPHCQKTAGLLSGIQKEYEGKGVQVLGATFDSGAAFRVQQFNKMFGVTYPCGYSTEDAVRQFLGLTKDEPYFVPILVFIDKTGSIRSQYIGDEKFLANQDVNIRAELDKILKGSPSSSRTTHPKAGKS
ncbi:MAG: TlpA disulfide reductase family protein [Acidobacteriota bacterium]